MARTKKAYNVEVGKRLRGIRENLGKSQEEAAELLDLSNEQYKRLEHGTSAITPERLRVIHEKLNANTDWLLFGEKMEEFDFDKYISNCTKEQKNRLLKRCVSYLLSNLHE